MKIEFWWTGRTQAKYLLAPIQDFEKRIKRFHSFATREFSSIKTKDVHRLKATESTQFLKQIAPGDYIVLLDEVGKVYTSEGFALRLQKLMMQGARRLVFIAGGSHGFSDSLLIRADARLSLSAMTFTHEMVRLFFLEQLYRAFTIHHNQPYHHS